MTWKTKQVYLGYLNNIGGNTLKVSYSKLDSNSDVIWTKRHHYFDICNNQWWMARVNNRTILPQEVCIDIDNLYYVTISQLKADMLGIQYLMFESRSGCHMHFHCSDLVWYSKSQRRKIREEIIGFLHGDLGLASENHTISLEYESHYKTGNAIKLLNGDRFELTDELFLREIKKPLYKCNSVETILRKIRKLTKPL